MQATTFSTVEQEQWRAEYDGRLFAASSQAELMKLVADHMRNMASRGLPRQIRLYRVHPDGREEYPTGTV